MSRTGQTDQAMCSALALSEAVQTPPYIWGRGRPKTMIEVTEEICGSFLARAASQNLRTLAECIHKARF